MQEEVNQKTVALAFQAVRFSGTVLKKAIVAYLNKHKESAAKSAAAKNAKAEERGSPHGKMTVEELVGQGQGATSIEIKDKGIRDFEAIARKNNVDFAVKQDQTVKPPKYLVFFKGKDTDVISQAFKEYVHASEKKKARPSLKAKLVGLKKMIAKDKNRERSRDKDHSRGAPSL